MRKERNLLLRTESYFAGKHPALVFLYGVTGVAFVALIDYFMLGTRISLQFFYLLPVGLVTWNLGRRWGIVMVFLASAAGFAAEFFASEPPRDLVPYWNAGVRFVLLLILAMLLVSFHESIDRQRARVDEERGVSDDLRELNEMKNTLLHAVSHDLKGPIAAIVGSVGTLRRSDQLQLTGGQREELIDAIEISGKKMNRLVEDLLDMDRIDRGDLTPERQPIDVGDLAKRVMRECEQIGPHPVRVEADSILANVDPVKVERIIENLLVNAARHTPIGTPIHVSVRARADAIVVVVEDEGPGIPDELKESLFDPFRQGPGIKGSGAGIGLSLVRKFAELHGGSAKIEDAPGGGARFVVVLPCKLSAKDVLAPKDGRLRAV